MNPPSDVASSIKELVEASRGAAERIARQMRDLRPYAELLETINVRSVRDQLIEAAAPIVEAQARWNEFAKIKASEIAALGALTVTFQDRIRDFLRTDFTGIVEAFRRLPAKTKQALLLLAEHGWYLDPKMALPALWEIAEALVEGNVLEVEDALVDYFERRLPEIEAELAAALPHRASLISMALGAHRRGEYGLAVPVLLAQSDGVCKEKFQDYFFLKAKQDHRPATARFVDGLAADTFLAALLSPLAEALPIAWSSKKRQANPAFTGLNRHTVMHGESLDYGTKANSLRALSLLQYVVHVLPESSGREGEAVVALAAANRS